MIHCWPRSNIKLESKWPRPADHSRSDQPVPCMCMFTSNVLAPVSRLGKPLGRSILLHTTNPRHGGGARPVSFGFSSSTLPHDLCLLSGWSCGILLCLIPCSTRHQPTLDRSTRHQGHGCCWDIIKRMLHAWAERVIIMINTLQR